MCRDSRFARVLLHCCILAILHVFNFTATTHITAHCNQLRTPTHPQTSDQPCTGKGKGQRVAPCST